MQNLIEYDDIKFQNASKEDLKLSDEEDAKKKDSQLKEAFKPLTKWWRKLLSEEGGLEAVKVSSRLRTTPCVIVTSKCARLPVPRLALAPRLSTSCCALGLVARTALCEDCAWLATSVRPHNATKPRVSLQARDWQALPLPGDAACAVQVRLER